MPLISKNNTTTSGLIFKKSSVANMENNVVKEQIKRPVTNVFEKRIPLVISTKQNKTNTNVGTTSNVTIIKPQVNRIMLKKNQVKSEINDENKVEEVNNVMTKKSIFPKSKIPVEESKVVKKSQTQAAVNKCQTKDPLNAAFEFYQKDELGFSSKLIPTNVENIDGDDKNNVLLLPDYINEIYIYLRKLEQSQSIIPDFLSTQPVMTPKMRSVLVDWLINVHYQFRLVPETLYLGIAIMDRFFQKQPINKDKIQLVGVTAFFIASKFEEIYPPDINDFVLVCDSLYHKRDIIKMEMAILKSLKFELGRPLPLHFLRRNSKAAHADISIHTMAKYLMELSLTEYDCAHWNPSLLAATSLYVTLRILSKQKWTPTLAHYSNYTEQELIPHAATLCKIIKNSEKSKFQNCRKKYSSEKLMGISNSLELKSPIVDEIASLS